MTGDGVRDGLGLAGHSAGLLRHVVQLLSGIAQTASPPSPDDFGDGDLITAVLLRVERGRVQRPVGPLHVVLRAVPLQPPGFWEVEGGRVTEAHRGAR